MKKYIVISPYSRALKNNKINPKNYPYWQTIIEELKNDFNFIQIGSNAEAKLYNIYEYKFDLSFNELTELICNEDCYCWMSVDNFLPHFCANINIPGIVIWGISDPKIFGHAMHTNLLKSTDYLRKDQFNVWEEAIYNINSFIPPTEIIKQIFNFKK